MWYCAKRFEAVTRKLWDLASLYIEKDSSEWSWREILAPSPGIERVQGNQEWIFIQDENQES